MSKNKPNSQIFHISPEHVGLRLDKYLAMQFSELSRSRLQNWVKSGAVVVNNVEESSNKYKLQVGDEVIVEVPEQVPETRSEAQNLPLDVVYQDEQLIVINKPAGLVVHPAAGNADGTMQNALLHHFPDTACLPRAGIVHRLDKQTTGLLVIARTPEAHKSLVDQLQARTVSREYDAIIKGELIAGGTVVADIGRHPVDRKRMAVRHVGGKEAITHYRVHERFNAYTHIKVKLETGRTHQIRVHMTHENRPLLGDPVYGARLQLPKGANEETQNILRAFKRQALHAASLSLIHPASGEEISWSAEMPDDMQQIIKVLRTHTKALA